MEERKRLHSALDGFLDSLYGLEVLMGIVFGVVVAVWMELDW